MKKRDLYIAALKFGRYKELAWLVRAFSVAKEPDDWRNLPEYTIVSNGSGHYCKLDSKLELIEDAVANEPVYQFLEPITLTPGDIPNCNVQTDTFYGNVLMNWILLVYPFGNKIEFMTGSITIPRITKLILVKYKEPGERGYNEESITTEEYKKFKESAYFLTGLTQIAVWTSTKKTLLPPPGIKELRTKLINQAKEEGKNLRDLATIASIQAELIKADDAWLAGDKSLKFLGSGKSRNVVRRKKFLFGGAETGFAENPIEGELLENSLYEGWDPKNFPAMMDSLRAASFDRGSETQLGGVSVKWLQRASANIRITVDDCGTEIGMETNITKDNLNYLVGLSIIGDQGLEHIDTPEKAETYLGKTIQIRSPQFCKLDSTDYCKTCVGGRLSLSPEGASGAIAAYGSQMLSMFLKAAHGRQLSVAEMVIEKNIV